MEDKWQRIGIGSAGPFLIGQAQDPDGGTGCTVILCPDGAFAAVDVRGGGPATRETDLLHPVNMVQQIHAVVLSGGSAFGLDAAGGVMAWLEERGAGFNTGAGRVPVVCGASLFDLQVGDPACRPDRAMGYEACQNAGNSDPAQGNVGAGAGATVGKYLGPSRMMKSGIGHYAAQIGEVTCGAIVAVNAVGDVLDAADGRQLAGLLSEDGSRMIRTADCLYAEMGRPRDVFFGNTTIGCILTNADLGKPQLTKVVSMAHNGLARTIHPVHTSADGDSLFIMSARQAPVNPDAFGTLCADVVARAVNEAVKAAKPAYGLKSAADFF